MGAEMRSFLLLASLLAGLTAGADMRVRDFSFAGVTNRFITPNGDAKNDSVTFKLSNPRDSSGSIKIYNVRGHLVTTLTVNPGDQAESWDARANGAIVPSGVYIYVISVEGTLTSGSVVVLR